ncbi:E3 ubiquitin-protein ligase CCNB1IP1 [Dictyocoela roeselum]|nr:E3 ubiquitin-protein ligase CCNB1IP1 [Dictyocoela roeselum]
MFLKCNNLRCRECVQKRIYITPCSHVFCAICAAQIQRMNLCIACKSFVKDREMISKATDDGPCLLGYAPEEIFEAAQKALSFWLYQSEQEMAIGRAVQEKAESAQQKAHQECLLMNNKFEIEKMNLRNTIDKLENKLEREKECNYDLGVMLSEKTKQYQKSMREVERLKYRNSNDNAVLRFDDNESRIQ